MRTRPLATLLAAAILMLSVAALPRAAVAQSPTVATPVKPTMPYKPSAQPTQKQAPGKSCLSFMLNSQAHKECIENQQKAKAAAKKTKTKS